MKEIRRVLILGVGAVGAAVATVIQDADPDGLAVLVDGERRLRYEKDGFIVNGRKRAFRLIGENDDWDADLIIVAVKHQQLKDAILGLRQRVGPESVVLSLLNGIESEETIGAVLGQKPPFAMILGIDAVREKNAVSFSSQGRIFFGESVNPKDSYSDRVRRIARYFDRVGVAYEIPADMLHALWFKFMINVGVNQVSALLKAPYGAIKTVPEAKILTDSAMREVIALSKAAGVPLSEVDLDKWYATLATLDPKGKTSMLQDVEAKRRTEVDIFAGSVMALGEKYGIDVPTNRFLYLAIKGLEAARESTDEF